ncbi:DUF6685 family protein [Stenotrophomonas sp.]|uniref:DUF6685 family protein n=1 Tax=Stenotrophomonas sp. TaxID=69392 RepID=UPI0028B1109A|nr:DUF6685 family protein [Stenotrophomonas sp.]
MNLTLVDLFQHHFNYPVSSEKTNRGSVVAWRDIPLPSASFHKVPTPNFLSNSLNSLQMAFGRPTGMKNLLRDHPNICIPVHPPKRCVALSSVVQWHKLGLQSAFDWPRRRQGSLIGWKKEGGRYASFEVYLPEFELIGSMSINKDWSCDITELDGFSASKSNLWDFIDTDLMVETNSPEMIDEVTYEQLKNNLDHREIRIIHNRESSDHFIRHTWDNRLFLANSGGSHHLAAAKYIAKRLHEPVRLSGEIHTYSLNNRAIASLRDKFYILAISDETETSLKFHDVMQSFGATWLSCALPAPYSDTTISILLPKSEKRSVQVAALLRDAGAFDLGDYLFQLSTISHLHDQH